MIITFCDKLRFLTRSRVMDQNSRIAATEMMTTVGDKYDFGQEFMVTVAGKLRY